MATVPFYVLILICCHTFLECNGGFQQLIYHPFGPKMCREFCKSSAHFLYFVEDLSCHRIITQVMNNEERSSTANSTVCMGHTLKDIHFLSALSEFNVCHKEYTREDLPTIPTLLAPEDECFTALQLPKDKFNYILLWACQGGRLGVVKFLISYGIADINYRGKQGRTPVMVTTRTGQMAVYRFLVSQDSDLSIVDDNEDNVLHIACKSGHIEIVRDLLNNLNYDINSRGQRKRTPVMTAAEEGHKSVVDFLIRKGCDLTAVDDNGNNILHAICLKGDLEMVKLILNFGIVDINSKGFESQTPLMMAVCNGHKGIVKYIVGKGCTLTEVDKYGNNILHNGCIKGNADLVKYILSLGIIDKDCKGNTNQTPAMKAAKYGHKGVVKYLVGKGCKLTEIDDSGNNILHIACVNGNVDLVDSIQSRGIVDINSKGRNHETPVMKAATYGHIGVVKYLVGKGCNLTEVDKYGNNILHNGCIKGNADLVKYILSLGIIDKDCKGNTNHTPAMKAVQYGHKGVVKYLFDKGCNFTEIDKNGNNILHIACVNGNVDVVGYILSLGIVDINSKGCRNQTPAIMAAKHGKSAAVKYLVDKGCNLTEVDKYGENILHMACIKGNVHLMNYILSLGIVDINSRSLYRETPLMKAARYGHLTVVKILVTKGCEMKAIDAKGNNILHLACIEGDLDMVKLILSYDVIDTDASNRWGNNILHLACKFEHLNLFKFLVSKGFNLTKVDRDGNTILHHACENGHLGMVKYLLTLKGIKEMKEMKNNNNKIPVEIASLNGKISMVKLLSQKH